VGAGPFGRSCSRREKSETADSNSEFDAFVSAEGAGGACFGAVVCAVAGWECAASNMSAKAVAINCDEETRSRNGKLGFTGGYFVPQAAMLVNRLVDTAPAVE